MSEEEYQRNEFRYLSDKQSHEYQTKFEESLNEHVTYGLLKNAVPTLSKTSDILNGSKDVLSIVASKKQQIKLELLAKSASILDSVGKNKVETIVFNQIKATQPKLDTVADRTGYLLFLESPSVSNIIGQNNEFKTYKDQLYVALNGINTQETKLAIEDVREAQRQGSLITTDTNIRIRNLQMGQERFKCFAEEHSDLLKNVIQIQKDNNDQAVHSTSAISTELKSFGINVTSGMEKLITENLECKNAVLSIINEMKLIEKREIDEAEVRSLNEGVHSVFGFVGALGAFTNNEGLIKLGTLGQSVILMKESMDAINKLDTVFSLANLSNFSNIATAALTIASLFTKKGPSEFQILNGIIQKLAHDLQTMRREMHDRFDRVETLLSTLQSLILCEFTELTITNYRIENLLINIQTKMLGSFEDTKDLLLTINNKIDALFNALTDGRRKDILKNILEKLTRIAGPHSITAEEFKVLFNELITLILQNDADIIGLSSTDTNVIVDRFEKDDNGFFNIASLQSCILNTSLTETSQTPTTLSTPTTSSTTITNPVIYSWLMSGFLLLLQSRYRISIPSNDMKISQLEFKELEKAVEIGKNTIDFCSNAFSGNIRQHLITQYKEARNEFVSQAYKKHLLNFEKTVADELQIQWQRKFDEKDVFLREAFSNQIITVTPLSIPGAFSGRSVHNCTDRKGRHRSDGETIVSSGNGSGPDAINRYRAEMDANIDAQKKSIITELRAPYVEAARTNIVVNKIEFNLYADSPVKRNPVISGIMEPENQDHPYLPLPPNFSPYIINGHILELVSLGLGYFKTSYSLVESNMTINLIYVGYIDNISHTVVSYTRTVTKYPNLTGKEAIWRLWMGGTFSHSEYTSIFYKARTDASHYDIYVNYPVVKNFSGARYSAFNTLEMKSGPAQVGSLCTSSLKQISDYKEQCKKRFAKSLMSEITNRSSDLAKALTKMSYFYYMLKSLLTVCGYTPCNFAFFKPEQANFMRNRLEFINANASTKPIDVTDQLNEIVINSQFDEHNHSTEYIIFSQLYSKMNIITNWYHNNIGVNDIDNSIAVEKRLYDETKFQRTALRALGSAICENVSSSVQKQLMESVIKNMASSGYIIEHEKFRVLMANTPTKEPNIKII